MPAKDSDLSLVMKPLRLRNLTSVLPLTVLLNNVVSPSGCKFSELLSIMAGEGNERLRLDAREFFSGGRINGASGRGRAN